MTDEPSFVESQMEQFTKESIHVPAILKQNARKISSIELLNDSKLENLHKELASLMHPILLSHTDFFTKALLNDDVTAFKATSLEILNDVPSEADALIIKMKIRLDELAKTVN
jgi:hypothetical protein